MRRLEGPELHNYDIIDPALAARVRIVRVPWLPPGSGGLTLGRFILLRHDDDRAGTRELLAHELVHVRQYAELGVARFLWRYLRDYVRNLWRTRSHRAAYLAIEAEVEAYAEAARWKKRAWAGPD